MREGRVPGTRVASLLAFLLCTLAVPGPVSGGGLDDARGRGLLLVGVKTDAPPFGYLDPSGKPAGFDVDVARYLAKALFEEEGRLEAVPVTSGSRIPFLYTGWVDMIAATMTVTEERRRVLDFSEPYFVSASMLLVLRGSRIGRIGDLAGRTVAVIEGSVQEKDLAEAAPAARRVAFKTIGEALRALKTKNVDALCQDDAVVRTLAGGDKGFKAAGPPIRPRPYAIAVRKGDAATLRWINEKLAAMRKDGSYERIREKYFGAGPVAEGKP